MAVRKFKPTSPGRRFMTVSDFSEITKSEPEKTLLAPLHKTRRAKRQRPHHHPPSGRWTQAPLPADRLQAQQGRRSGQGALDRVRPQPVGADRACCITPTARSATSSRRCGCASARPSSPARAWTSALATRCRSRHAHRYHGAQRRAAARTGRQDGALGRRLGPAGRPRGRQGAAAPALRRDAPRHEECRATVGQLGNVTHEIESGGKAGRSRWKGKRPTCAARS